MVRVPMKSCQNLSHIFDAAEPALVAGFLNSKSFERFGWLKVYKTAFEDIATNDHARQMLGIEPKDRLKPLETEAARVVTLASGRGQFALDGVASTKLASDRLRTQTGQRDELARSLWTFIFESMLFEAAENSLHMRLYRRYDRHYQTFMAEPSSGTAVEAESGLLRKFLVEVEVTLNRGEGYSIDRFEIPADDGEPAAELYVLFHPNPATSVKEIDDDGNRTRIYFRPPGEVMIVYFPSTGRVHVRADTRVLRHRISEKFIEEVLKQPLSSQPVDFQAYDISQFRTNFAPTKPVFDDVLIVSAKVIRVEVSIENLATRLSISTSLKQDLGSIIENQPKLGEIFERAIATRLVEFAIEYRLKDKDDQRTLNFTLTDRNTCSLLSLEDPFERILGHRLLREWGIAREGREPSHAESMHALPALLDLWNIGREMVSGAWLYERGIDPGLLIDVGFLVPAGADEMETEDLVDQEDRIGAFAAKVVERPSGHSLQATPGHEVPSGSPEIYRVYRVRVGWVAQHLRTHMAGIFRSSVPEVVDTNLVKVGSIRIEDRDVPVYLARGLFDDETRVEVDSQLRVRRADGVGLVLQAGRTAGNCFAGNVLTPLTDHLTGSLPDIGLNMESLCSAYVHNHVSATGGEIVQLKRIDDSSAILSVPGKGTIEILGEHRVNLIQKLFGAHEAGKPRVSSDDLRAGIKDQSLANIFGQPLYDKLKADFIRSPRRPYWEIAV